MCGCLLMCPVYDLLSVLWHKGIFLWVDLMLIVSQVVSQSCLLVFADGRFAEYITLKYRIP